MKKKIIEQISKCNREIEELEEKILTSLYHSDGNIIDDAVLIETLQNSKKLSEEIKANVKIAHENNEEINEKRNQ